MRQHKLCGADERRCRREVRQSAKTPHKPWDPQPHAPMAGYRVFQIPASRGLLLTDTRALGTACLCRVPARGKGGVATGMIDTQRDTGTGLRVGSGLRIHAPAPSRAP